MRWLLVLLSCLVAAAAGATELDEAVVGKWFAQDLSMNRLDPTRPPWVEFDERARAKGHDGCNSFSATIGLQDGNVQAVSNSLRQALEFCRRDEQLFTAHLMAARTYVLVDSELPGRRER